MIYLGADHGGYELKEEIKQYLSKKGLDFEDLGNKEHDENDDYPDYAFAVSERVAENKNNRGILLCRSSGGMVIAANKVKGIRAVSCHDVKSARHAREHNNANVITMPADWLNKKQTMNIVETFLDTLFTNEKRHVKRLKKIEDYEETQ